MSKRGRKIKPLIYKGQFYASASEASQQQGVSKNRIRHCCQNNIYGSHYIEDEKMIPKRVIFEGKEYESITQAAKDNYVSYTSMRRYARKGLQSFNDVIEFVNSSRRKQVVFKNVLYRDAQSASQITGYSIYHIMRCAGLKKHNSYWVTGDNDDR